MTKEKLIKICITLAIYTTSFDIVGMINVSSFNFRFTQFIILPVFVVYLYDILKTKKINIPKFSSYLLIWTLFQFVYMFRSPNFKNALGYLLWLLFNIAVIFSLDYYCDKCYTKEWLLRTYINSFVFMGVIGLIQLVLYYFGINFFATQYWNERLARINGFSYEPSYYSTYMIMGVITLWVMYKYNIFNIFSKKRTLLYLIITLTALILSSSRMGWLVLVLFLIYEYVLKGIYKILRINKISKRAMYIWVLMPLILVVGIYFLIKIDFSRFLVGLGIGGSGSWSSGDRINGLTRCLKIFLDEPILGYSLGGVDPMISKYYGLEYSIAESNGQGFSIIGELLVASGIVGIIPFIIYFFNLIFKKPKNDIQRALKVALFFELVILCFNQNILRPYFWMHIAILTVMLRETNTTVIENE